MSDETPYFDQDEETGQITQEYPESAFIEAVTEHTPASTSEVGEAVGCSSDNAYRRLKALEEDGKVESKMAGNSLIWFPVE
jgi:predicted ArsR family transcriptional regulator